MERDATASAPASASWITCSSSSRGTAGSICRSRRLAISMSISITPSEDLGIALGEAVSEGARRPPRHQSRRLLRDADGRDARRRRRRSRRPAPHGGESEVAARRVGDLQTELVHDFFEGFAIGARANVHVKVMYGRSSHHKIEAVLQGVRPRAQGRVRAGQAARPPACRQRKDCCELPIASSITVPAI